MKRAADKKRMTQRQLMQSAHQLSCKIDNHMLSRDKAAEDVYMSKFEKNILKRTEVEKR